MMSESFYANTVLTTPSIAIDVMSAYSQWAELNTNYRTHREIQDTEYNPYQIIPELIEEFYKDGFYLTTKTVLLPDKISIVILESETSNLDEIKEIPKYIRDIPSQTFESAEEIFVYKGYVLRYNDFEDIGIIIKNVCDDVYGLPWDEPISQGGGYTVIKSKDPDTNGFILKYSLNNIEFLKYKFDPEIKKYSDVARDLWLLLDDGMKDNWIISFFSGLGKPKEYNDDPFFKLYINRQVEVIGISADETDPTAELPSLDEVDPDRILYHLITDPLLDLYESINPCKLFKEILRYSQDSDITLENYYMRTLTRELGLSRWSIADGVLDVKIINYPNSLVNIYSNMAEKFTNQMDICDFNYLRTEV